MKIVCGIGLGNGCRNDLEVPTSGFLGGSVRAQGQGPPPMLAERFQSVITQLFQQVWFVSSRLRVFWLNP